MRIGIIDNSIEKKAMMVWKVLVFLMLAFPVFLQWLKVLMLLLLFVFSVFSSGKTIKYTKAMLVFCTSWLLFNVGNTFLGVLYNNPGTWECARLNILYYSIFFVLLGSYNEDKYFFAVVKGVYYANWFIALYNIAYLIFAHLGKLDVFPIIDSISGVGLHEGYTHITTTNLSMTLFTFPMMLIFQRDQRIGRMFGKKRYWIMIFLTAIIMIMSGRRILWISLAISIVVWIAKEKRINRKIRNAIIVFFSSIIFIVVLGDRIGIDIEGIASRFLNAFSRTDSEYQVENVRYIQALYLWKGFLDEPVFGHGAGSVLSNYLRSDEVSWAYELCYNKTLYDGGVVGFAIYAFSLLSICYFLARNRGDIISNGLLLAYFLALIANATNPYFSQNFDFLLFILIPLMYLNTSKNSCDNYWYALFEKR